MNTDCFWPTIGDLPWCHPMIFQCTVERARRPDTVAPGNAWIFKCPNGKGFRHQCLPLGMSLIMLMKVQMVDSRAGKALKMLLKLLPLESHNNILP